MNGGDKKKFEQDVTKTPLQLTSGAGRSQQEKEANYNAIVVRLQKLKINTQATDIADAVAILTKAPNALPIETAAPPKDNGAASKLKLIQAENSGVSTESNGVHIQLDCDQLKHQAPSTPIGWRHTGSGNQFINTCNEAWHRANTLPYMAGWASALQMKDGDDVPHGQMKNINGIHYEGHCLFTGGKKYVTFHCYPDNSNKKLLLK